MHTALQPAAYRELALAVTEMQDTSRQEKNSEQSASNMAARTLQMHMRLVVVKRGSLLQYRYGSTRSWNII